MDKYLAVMALYGKAGRKSIIIMAASALLCFPLVSMITGKGIEGVLPVLLIIAVLYGINLIILNSINGRKAQKNTHATTGYTLRRLCISPVLIFWSVFVYCLLVIVLFWGIMTVSLYAAGFMQHMTDNAMSRPVQLALDIVTSPAGHGMIPLAHPQVIAFNVIALTVLAADCARSCYLGWHNGRQSAGTILIAAAMFYVWAISPKNSFISLTIMTVALYGICIIADVMFREKRPKGDPFTVNRYTGIIDMDSDSFNEDVYMEVELVLR